MTIWYTTVLDAVRRVCAATGWPGALVMEDTILLRPDVSYETVVAEVHRRKAPAGVFGYGNKLQKRNPQGYLVIGWFGVKGVWMTPAWCEKMICILQNTNYQHCHHVDMWLRGLLKRQQAQGFQLFEALAGFGHRMSLSESRGDKLTFGGAWVPRKLGHRPDDRGEHGRVRLQV